MPDGYYRSPTIHDNTIVFTCEDDLWTVPSTGGIARRLISGLGAASSPLLSPDGTQIAFVGREDVRRQIYVMPAAGGAVKRLTFRGSTSNLVFSAWDQIFKDPMTREILSGAQAPGFIRGDSPAD